MRLPKFHETFFPILIELNSIGDIHYNELLLKVRDNHFGDLPDELLQEKTTSGSNTLLNRIGWGKSYLKMAKMIEYPARSMVRITEKGKAAISAGHFTLADLKVDPDYKEYTQSRDAFHKVEVSQSVAEVDGDDAISTLTPQDMIDQGIEAIEKQIMANLLEKLKTSNPYYFEMIALKLFEKMGYGSFIETTKSNDGGIDGIINEDRLGLDKIFIQAKRFSDARVGRTVVDAFIGAMAGRTHKGIIVTTSLFTETAYERVKEVTSANTKITLIDGPKLVALMYTYGVGVQVKNIYEVKEIDEDFFEGGGS